MATVPGCCFRGRFCASHAQVATNIGEVSAFCGVLLRCAVKASVCSLGDEPPRHSREQRIKFEPF